jgi:chemotaxis protein MotB
MRRAHRHEDHDEHPSEAWLIALADMMTLLMVTFLMMFAISSLDLKKFQTFKQAFAEGTGTVLPQLPGEGVPTEGDVTDQPLAPENGDPVPQASAWVPNPGGPGPVPLVDRDKLKDLQKTITQRVQSVGLADKVDVAADPRGLVLYVTSGVLFDTGEAQLTGDGSKLLQALGSVFRGMRNPLVVEGHTDSRPISSAQYPSNWELSTARATVVLRYLHDSQGIGSSRLSAAGYADTKPRAKGDTETAWAKNRRVEIVVSAPVTAAPASGTTTGTAGASTGATPAPAPAPSSQERAKEDESDDHDDGGH